MTQTQTMRKRCRKCDKRKPLTAFAKCANGAQGVAAYCGPCRKQYDRDNRERIQENRAMRMYGCTREQAQQLVASPCAICGAPPPSHIDHDHATGEVRGPLCFSCNTGIGSLGDDPARVQRALDYLLGAHRVDGAASAAPDVGA